MSKFKVGDKVTFTAHAPLTYTRQAHSPGDVVFTQLRDIKGETGTVASVHNGTYVILLDNFDCSYRTREEFNEIELTAVLNSPLMKALS